MTLRRSRRFRRSLPGSRRPGAKLHGDTEAAKRAFLAAQWRDPRSLPAAYFLANYYFRVRAIRWMASNKPRYLLACRRGERRRSRRSSRLTRRTIRIGRRCERCSAHSPRSKMRVLVALAQDARNADAILAIADADHRSPDSNWLGILLANLIAQRRLYLALARSGRRSEAAMPPNSSSTSSFSNPGPPAPFNWVLTSSTLGLAERAVWQSAPRHLLWQ